MSKNGIDHLAKNLKDTQGKAPAFLATSGKGAWANGMTLIMTDNDMEKDTICVASRGRKRGSEEWTQRLEESKEEGKSNCLTRVDKDNLILQRPRGYNKGGEFEGKTPVMTSHSWQHNNYLVVPRQLNPAKESNGGTQPFQQNRVYDTGAKSPTQCAGLSGGSYAGLSGGSYMVADASMPEGRIRRLTPTECARLQTIPDWYKWRCSETQQYRMLGNGWTVEVIKHILSFLPEEMLKGNINNQ